MNITRNNYEEYFLLYADGELNAVDKKVVEHFVTLHPDLGEELEMLMEAVLDTTHITMPGKHLLLKAEEWSEETLTPQQKDLFLLLDKELPSEKATALQEAIKKDPVLQKDWSVLQQTQLPAAIVEMPEKETLYRHERDRRPIPITWVKWMAAAAVGAGLGWYSISLWNSRQVATTPNVATVKSDQENSTPVRSAQPTTTDHSTSGATVDQATAGISIGQSKKTAIPAVNIVKSKTTKAGNAIQQIKDAGNETEPVYAALAKQQQVIETVHVIELPANTVAVLNPKEINNSLTTQANPNTIIQEAPTDPNDDGVDEYVNIAGAHIKKQKLRGIIRNVTRTVGRTFDKSNVAQADVASLNN